MRLLKSDHKSKAYMKQAIVDYLRSNRPAIEELYNKALIEELVTYKPKPMAQSNIELIKELQSILQKLKNNNSIVVIDTLNQQLNLLQPTAMLGAVSLGISTFGDENYVAFILK